ncbi:MAG: lysophospholipid acyltransferase family protein [Pseudomonadota bacterium]
MILFRYLMSLIFILQMYLMMVVLALVYLIPAIISRRGALAGIHAYCHWVRFSARVLCGLRSEIRGEVPTGEALIAAKHQSFFDIIVICSVTPRPRFIMKKELKWAPILGWYAQRIGCVPVDRGKKGRAIAEMQQAVANNPAGPGQLIIYPQGTRVAPEVVMPYKVGAGLLYQQLGQSCVPAATNIGVFWPRHGILRKPGLAVVEFLPVIAPGLGVAEFTATLERAVESNSDRLMAEAGFVRS